MSLLLQMVSSLSLLSDHTVYVVTASNTTVNQLSARHFHQELHAISFCKRRFQSILFYRMDLYKILVINTAGEGLIIYTWD